MTDYNLVSYSWDLHIQVMLGFRITLILSETRFTVYILIIIGIITACKKPQYEYIFACPVRYSPVQCGANEYDKHRHLLRQWTVSQTIFIHIILENGAGCI